MKLKVLLLFIFFFPIVLFGQENTRGIIQDTSQNETKERTHDLYKRLNEKDKGKLGINKHEKFPTLSSAISFGKSLVDEDTKNLAGSDNFLSIDFRVGYQTVGNNIYNQLWRYPKWGVGYYGVSLYNDTLFGVPNALFAYIDIPFNKWDPNRKWNFSYSIAGGLSFNFRPNNPQINPLNTLIGSYNNVYIDFGLWANYKINKSMDAKLGLSFVHFSNGASNLPNMGMNLLGAKVILEHNVVQERPEVYVRTDIPAWKKKHGLFIYQAVGAKQLSNHGTSYFNSTTSLAYKYWMGYKSQLIGQIDAFYDSSNNSGEPPREMVPEWDRNNPANLWSVGAFVGYEAVYNRISFVCGWGYYLWRNYDYTANSYQRFGIRYRVYEGFVVGAGLKARSFAADYIEWSVGYNLF